MKIITTRFYLLLMSLLLLSGCSTLAPFRAYTDASARGVAAFAEVDYSFTHNCEGNCRDRDLAALRINRLDCNCEDSRLADSVNLLMYRAITNYLLSLGQLAKRDLTALPVKELGSSITANKIIKLTEQDVDAFNTLSDLISSALTNTYRKEKLKTYINIARASFNTVINSLQFNLSKNLNGVLNIRQQRIKADYYELLNNRANTAYDKRRIVEDYYTSTARMEGYQERLNSFTQILEEIKNGHEQIYQHLEQLSSAQLEARLLEHAQKIDALIAEMTTRP